jgi:hypothetical protein
MKQADMIVGTLHIVSNMMEFNDDGLIVAFKEPLIHILVYIGKLKPQNKNEANIKGLPYFNSIKQRNNVILMGDSEGDPHMGEGLEHKVEFLIF